MTADGEWMSVAAAGRALGYRRSRAYSLKTELGAEPDPATGRFRIPASRVDAYRASPPPRRRPAPSAPRPLPDRDAWCAALDDLARRVEALELQGEDPPAPDDDVGAAGWRRQAIAARDALAQVAMVGDLYEEVLAADDDARALDRQAAERRAGARTALRELLAAHRAALRMAAAPVDPGDGQRG